MPSPFTICRLSSNGWSLLRELRLDALRNAPKAFAAQLADEEKYDEATWRARADNSAWFVAFAGECAVGLVCGSAQLTDADDPDERHLMGLWTHPDRRGRGVGRTLIGKVMEWAADDGARAVFLWVETENQRALDLYLYLGFHPGIIQPFPTDPSRKELRMTRRVGVSALSELTAR